MATILELLDELEAQMERSAKAAAEVTRVANSVADELAVYQMDEDDAKDEIARIRRELEGAMTEAASKTSESSSGKVQATRARREKMVVTNEDMALAHLADLDRLNDFTAPSYDWMGIREFAKTNPLDGIEKRVEHDFRVTRKKT